MTVNTKQATGRRQIRFDSYADLLADVEKLAAGETELVGNWTLAQVCKHLASALNACIDGVPFRAPLPMRITAKLFLKKKFLSQTLPAGFQVPGSAKKQFEPDDSVDLQEQLAALHQAIDRVKNDTSRALHPFFDQLTNDQWDQYNLRHAELHLSFIKPAT